MAVFLREIKVKHNDAWARSLCKDALSGEVEYGVLPIAQSKHVHIGVLFPQSEPQQVGRGVTIFNVQHDGLKIAVFVLRQDSPPGLSAERRACPTVEKRRAHYPQAHLQYTSPATKPPKRRPTRRAEFLSLLRATYPTCSILPLAFAPVISFHVARSRQVLFGSMLRPEVERLNDVDLAVQLEAKEKDIDRLRARTLLRVEELAPSFHAKCAWLMPRTVRNLDKFR
jgi:hypothetical protein